MLTKSSCTSPFQAMAAAFAAEEKMEVLCPSGLRYVDVTPGRAGGAPPLRGDLVVVHYTGRLENGEVFVDTRARNKPIAFVFGGRPFAGVCMGVMEGLGSMQPGSKRVMIVPPVLGFGSTGTMIIQATCDGIFCDKSPPPPNVIVPTNALLRYEVELLKVTKIPAQMSR